METTVTPTHFCSSFPYLTPDAQPLFTFGSGAGLRYFVIGSMWVMKGIGGRDGVLFLLERWEFIGCVVG